MLRLLINDKALDLPDDFRIQVRRNNPAYLGKDVGVIKADFSYPFRVAMSGRNRSLLHYPDRVDNAEQLPQNLPAKLYVGPDLLLVGKVNCLRADRAEAEVFFVNNPLADLTKVKMNEVKIGGYAYSSVDALIANMRDSTVNPLARPWIAFPVYNRTLREGTAFRVDNREFQNSYDFGSGDFRREHPLSLFLRAEWLLRAMMEEVGYSWTDLFHTTDEHKRMVLVNNRGLNVPGGAVTLEGDYNHLLPDDTVADFLKNYCRLHCLAPFVTLTGGEVTLQPLRNLVNAAPADDWTEYAAHNYSRETNPSLLRLAFGQSSTTTHHPAAVWGDDRQPDRILTVPVADPADFPTSVTDFYLRGSYYQDYNDSARVASRPLYSFGSIDNPGGKETMISKIDAMQGAPLPIADNDIINAPVWGASIAAPVAGQIAAGTGSEEVDLGSIEHRLAIYRGRQLSANRREYPMGYFNNFNFDNTPIEGERLAYRWIGEGGLYNENWAEWDGMLRDSSAITRNFVLPLPKLLAFDFRDKIRVGNLNVFVRSMEFEVSAGGVSETKCELITVA